MNYEEFPSRSRSFYCSLSPRVCNLHNNCYENLIIGHQRPDERHFVAVWHAQKRERKIQNRLELEFVYRKRFNSFLIHLN
jgi:hypothetical protein